MASSREYRIVSGDETIVARLPERTRVLAPPPSLLPLDDPVAAVREALAAPVGMVPLARCLRPGARVVIAFDDPAKPVYPMEGPDLREMAIPLLLEACEAAGVRPGDVHLICANALHRKWTRPELASILGPKLPMTLLPSRLACHDAEDPANIVALGETERGFEVELNRAIVEADLVVYLGVPATPFNGGWKSIVVGLSTFRSIRYHHRPWPAASGKSTQDHRHSSFHKLMNEMGAVVERALAPRGTQIMQVEGLLTARLPHRLAAVVAGRIPDAHHRLLELMERQQVIEVPGQSDVVVYGVANRDNYSRHSVMNPILVRNSALSYHHGMFQNRPLVREGGILIFVNPCRRQFSEINHPSYVTLYEEILPRTRDPFEIWELYAEDFAHRPEFVHKYRYAFGFHGAHPLILWGQGAAAFRHAGRIFAAGVEDFDVARRLDFEPFGTVEEAIAEAERCLGTGCSIAYHPMPPTYYPRVV